MFAPGQVNDARVDVLVDLDGWNAGGRPSVLALRPAALQATPYRATSLVKNTTP